VARRVNQVEDIVLAVVGAVVEPHGLSLDGDAALTLQVHLVQELVLLFPGGNGAGELKQAVGDGRFAMVDMGDDGEIAYVLEYHIVLYHGEVN